ncbi:MAG: hypothetical protein V4733_10450 [Verrucomicrobiota bacterium]
MNSSTSTAARRGTADSRRKGSVLATGMNSPKHREPHLVILRQSVAIDIVGGPRVSQECIVRLAIEQFEAGPTLAVTLMQGEDVVACWPQKEVADVLQIFRLFRLVSDIRIINREHLQPLLSYVCAGELPTGNANRRFRKGIRHLFSAAMAYVPSPNDVCQALLHCKEFKIAVDTDSLSALAAAGRFDVTKELAAQGVVPGNLYRARSTKIEELLVGMRQQIDSVCGLLGITFDSVRETVVTMIECGIEADTVCGQIAVQYFDAKDPDVFQIVGPTLRSGHRVGGHITLKPDPVTCAVETVAQALQLNVRHANALERDLLGLNLQMQRGTLRKVEASLL